MLVRGRAFVSGVALASHKDFNKRRRSTYKNSVRCVFARTSSSYSSSSSSPRPRDCIFTDASVRDSRIGLGAVLFDSATGKIFATSASFSHYALLSNTRPQPQLRTRNDSTYAELLAILFGLKLYAKMTKTSPGVDLLTDSSPAIWHVSSKRTKYPLVVDEIRREIASLLSTSTCTSVDLSHVKGHDGVYGNEIADRLATRGRSVRSDDNMMVLFPGAMVKYRDVVAVAPEIPLSSH